MSRIVTIARRSVERVAGLIATPWAATIGIIFLLRWIFDVVPEGAPPDSADQRLVRRCARVDRAAADQTPVVHSVLLLTHTAQHSYRSAAARWATAHPSVPRSRQRRRPSALAISAALHGGSPR
jgi:hypothetical protein